MSELHERTIEAGRELDALVAEKVMEEAKPETPTENVFVSPSFPIPSLKHAWALWDIYGETSYQWIPKPYSTSIAAAWEVVEKVYELKRQWILVSPFNSHKPFVAYHKTGCGDEDFGDFCEFAETAPHAICLAALKAAENGGVGDHD